MMGNKTRNWTNHLPRVGLGSLLLCGSMMVYADLIRPPVMSVTEDQFNYQPKLNFSLYQSQMQITSDGLLTQPLGMYVYSNYSPDITNYRIDIYRASDKDLVRSLQQFTFDSVNPYEAILWNGQLAEGRVLDKNSDYQFVLTVTDKEGRISTTQPVYFRTLGYGLSENSDFIEQGTLANGMPVGILAESAEIPGFGDDNTKNQGVVAQTRTKAVVVQMGNLKGKQNLTLNGERLVVDDSGRAMRELLLPPGEYHFDLSWTDENGEHHTQRETLQVEERKHDVFYVGLIETTYAQNNVSGDGKSILQDADEHHYSGKGSWDGRVAFYVKGHVDELRFTAHLDTTETKLKNAFGKIWDRDPSRFTRELDPEAYYPIYGDDSTIENDVDTQGKFYLKLEKGKNYLLWGNYNTQMTGTEFADFNRSLYGAKFQHESEKQTQFGDTRSYLTLFAATGDTRGSHNEMASTGGSLYFLKHQRITEGSLKLTVEYRDQNTGRVKSTATLTEGIDYEIDNFQGRLMLNKPLPMTANSDNSIISGGNLLGGDRLWIIAEYEYYSDGFDMEEQSSYGARGFAWLGDHIRVGGSYINEDQSSGDNFEVKGADVIVRATQGTYTKLEYATSESGNNDIFISTNGGLGYSQSSLGSDTKGAAWKIEQQADLGELLGKDDLPLTFNGYFSKQQAGFSSFSTARNSDLVEWGGEVRYDFEENKSGILASYTHEEDSDNYQERIARAQVYQALSDTLKGAIEMEYRREDNLTVGITKETLAAVKLEKELFEGRDTAYVIQQITLDKQGDVRDNNKTTIGYHSQVTESLKLGAEAFSSNRGAGGGVLANWDINDRASVYTTVMNDIDSSAGRGITTTIGTNVKATSQMDLYSERQFKHQQTQRTTSDVYGVKYKPTESQTVDFAYSTGRVNDRSRSSVSLSGTNDTRRDVYTFTYGYKNDWFQIRDKVEFRWESGNDEKIKQWVTTNRAKTTVSENLSWLAQLDLAKTTGSSDVVNNYIETAIGFAYRPINMNNLNLFGKVTFVQGYDPDDQLVASTTSNGTSFHSEDYEQRSWVYSLEGVYEWNANWETALKAAFREGSLRYKGEDEWYSSDAALYAARVNFKYSDFEYQVELRTLRSNEADDHKDGVVTSVYYNVNDNMKMGVGYNFTDYNDNLTHLNYKSRGWFVNVVGSF